MTGLVGIVFITKVTVLGRDRVATTALLSLLVGTVVLSLGARAAWRRSADEKRYR